MSRHWGGVDRRNRSLWQKGTRLSFIKTCLLHNWNESIVNLTKLSPLVALEVVRLTTFNAANDENFIKNEDISVSVVEPALYHELQFLSYL